MAKKGAPHWTQTPEGKLKASEAQRKRHMKNRELTPTGKNPDVIYHITIDKLQDENQQLREHIQHLIAAMKLLVSGKF